VKTILKCTLQKNVRAGLENAMMKLRIR